MITSTILNITASRKSCAIRSQSNCMCEPLYFKSLQKDSFESHNRNKSADVLPFLITNLDGMQCAYCGERMLSGNKQAEIVNEFAVSNKMKGATGKRLRTTMAKYREWVNPELVEAYDCVAELSQRYNKRDFAELLEIVVNDEVEYEDCISDTALRKNLLKNMKKNPIRVIVRKFFDAKTASKEHIHPNSKGGTLAPSNILAVHKDCNSKRGNAEMGDFMSEDIYENLSLYLQELPKILEENGLSQDRIEIYMDTLIENISKNLWSREKK